MKLLLLTLCLMILPLSATSLQLSSVKQVVYLHGSDTEIEMTIMDIPFATAYSSPEWLFSAISSPFIPATDGSWRDPSDINLASIYGIKVSGTYKENNKDVEAIIDLTNAKKPEGYPFSIEEVAEQVKKCVTLMYPYDPKIDSKLEIRVIKAKE